MSQGHEVSGYWWRKSAWSVLSKRLPQHLKDLLEPLSQVLVKLEELIAPVSYTHLDVYKRQT